jgi:hypothetical protein
MPNSILNQPHFHDEAAAFAKLESIVWPNGPVCPHCGGVGRAYALNGVKDKKGRVRLGLKKCGQCRGQFTVRKNTVFESSHVPLHIWFQATFLLCSSKKGVSSNQLHRTLGVTLKTAWFMGHRLREAMRVLKMDPIGGEGKFVESDETFVGGKARNRAYREPPPKEAVMALVERGGRVASYHVPNVTAATLKQSLPTQSPKIRTSARTRVVSIGKSGNNSPVTGQLFILSMSTSEAMPIRIPPKAIFRS